MASATPAERETRAQAATTQLPIIPGRACEACNRKKTKCDMRRPSCGLCSRTAAFCQYPSRRKKPTRNNYTNTANTHPMKSQPRRNSTSLMHLLELIDSRSRFSEAMDDLLRHGFPQTSLRGSLKATSLQDDPQCEDYRSSSNSSPLERVANPVQPRRSSEPDETCSDTASIRSLSNLVRSPTTCQPSSEEYRPAQFSVSPSLALDLISLFFVKIQAWLPLFHQPRFEARYQNLFSQPSLALSTLRNDELFLLYSMFSLSARYSVHPDLQSIDANRRGTLFAEYATQLYQGLREEAEPSFTWAQGCVLFAFYLYTSGPTHQGWMLIGICSRLVYDFELSNLDSTDWKPISSVDGIDKEELRRVWWSVYELDIFASTMSQQPYSIDRKRMVVNLPVADAVWFAGGAAVSSLLNEDMGQLWESLQNSNNQDARAWFLASNSLLARLSDRLQHKEPMSPEEILLFGNDLSSFRMSLPKVLRLEREQAPFPCLEKTDANWIIGIHLMLLTCSYMISSAVPDQSETGTKLPSLLTSVQPVHQRAAELSRLLRFWEPELVATAHPFFCCMLVCPYPSQQDSCLNSPIVRSCSNLVKLILNLYAENWKLASTMLRILELFEQGDSPSREEKRIMKRFSIYFPTQTPTDRPYSATTESTQNGMSLESAVQPIFQQAEALDILADTYHFTVVDSQLNHVPLPNVPDMIQVHSMTPAQISMYSELPIHILDNEHMTNDLTHSNIFPGCSTGLDESLRS